MSRALGVLVVLVAAFIVLIGVLSVFAGIAPAFPTTEEAFLKIGAEIKGVLLVIVGAVLRRCQLLPDPLGRQHSEQHIPVKQRERRG